MIELTTRDQFSGPENAWRSPMTPANETVLYDEPGRILVLKPESNFDVCFQAYHFRITKDTLYVKHGGGQESFRLPCSMSRAFATMTSDARYFTCHAIMDAAHEAQRAAVADTSRRYHEAFVNGRLKKRKLRGQALAKVWIEAPPEARA
jgi:hypothetical protein